MTKAVRVSVGILGGLVVVSVVVAVLALVQKQTLQGQNAALHNQIASDESQLADLTTQVKKLKDNAEQLNNKISQTQKEKAQSQSNYDDLKHKSDDLLAQLGQANTDRDDWKNRAGVIGRQRDDLVQKLKDLGRERDGLAQNLKSRSRERDDLTKKLNDWKNRVKTISRERDGLVRKLKNLPTKIVYKDRMVQVAPTDEYWASVLRQKAALQIEVGKGKSDLDQAALQVVDLKKQKSDLEVGLKQISNERDEIIQKIKYGQDLADSLSIDLARSRNDQQAVNDRAGKLKAENLELLSQIRELSSTKLGLERTIARLTDNKDEMQRKLIETQSVIRSRVDDIWKIKESLDKKLSPNVASSAASGSMELPPIIVNAPNNQQQAPPESTGKSEGSVISINQSNNFVIMDLGHENSPVNVGTILKVYRASKAIATLEVIQVRRDICAADIKEKSSELKVGDTVKFN